MNMGIGIMLAVVCAVICAIVAEEKGRSAIAWGFIGFFFGVIGLLIIIVIGLEKEPQVIIEKQTIVEERKPIKKTESRFYINDTYSEAGVLSIAETKFLKDDLMKFQVMVRTYGNQIKHMKADVTIRDTFGDDNCLEKMVLDFKSMDDEGWQISEICTLQSNQLLSLEHIRRVTVMPISFITNDDKRIKAHADWQKIEDLKGISEVRQAFGQDAFVVFEDKGTSYRCVCGKINEGIECTRCGRRKELLERGDSSEGLISELKKCQKFSEAKVVYEKYEKRMRPNVTIAFKERLDKDIYIKKMYGGSDFDVKIENYINLITEDAG